MTQIHLQRMLENLSESKLPPAWNSFDLAAFSRKNATLGLSTSRAAECAQSAMEILQPAQPKRNRAQRGLLSLVSGLRLGGEPGYSLG